ncbi:hypothetical protein AKJ25_01935 [Corynebacterium glutamicum]|nr:hypothetical protein AUO96_11640 [Corynebacterium glutamicum]TWS33150.1 hypothetical protein AKJ19_10020 [Corynebacterium glutamicum]TWS46617.1 hypothetical protein AKJ26_10065 [Corynebacterium glutamicum]TWS52738.1 hypothetical protein AKJ25_01935 [Corynebacterium glutamicum]TWS54540.1 hypothetical protein AKJ27_10745 [Corynebacterium glutamicum]
MDYLAPEGAIFMSKPEGNLGGALSNTDRLNKGFARGRDPLEAENVYWEYRNNGVWIRINTDNNFQVTTADGLTGAVAKLGQ